MIVLKNYFVTTTKDINFIPIIHDVRFAIKDSGLSDGLATITIPQSGASLVVTSLKEEELAELKEQFMRVETDPLSLSLPFQNKELVLSPKQMIYLLDKTDSGKRREFYVQVMGDTPQPQQPATRRGRK